MEAMLNQIEDVAVEPLPSSKANQTNINNNNNNNININNTSKRKSKHDRNGRKRSKSFSGCGLNKLMMNMKPVLPTKFLLGGNINDPLNLNSLQDEEINRAMNAITPKSSPIPTPPRRKQQIEVIIPPNIHDPLNLIDCADDAEYEQQLLSSPIKKGRKKRLKKRRTVSATIDLDIDLSGNHSEAKTPENSTDSAKIPPQIEIEITKTTEINEIPTNNKDLNLELPLSPKKETKTNKRKSDEYNNVAKKFKNAMDKIVSPVVPQPGAWLKRTNSIINKRKKPRQNKTENEEMPLFKEKNKQFQYGNYNRYYGYRNPNNEVDQRLKVFSYHPYLFDGKDILDIGCNIGHVTLSVARDFGAKTVTGIDIDPKLINIARKNVKYYVKNSDTSHEMDQTNETCSQDLNTKLNRKCSSEFFPISMPILYGTIDIPGYNDIHPGRDFPNNVIFKQCNYILDDDSLLQLEQPQFDVILCLSITKWIHLNWGDSGIKQAFRRMYAQLRPGGKLILEPQNWASYKSKRKLTEAIYKNYNSIEFFPEKFTEYLLSSVIGFAKSEILGYPHHNSKGFRRPIQVFTKSTMFPSERVEATPNNNSVTPNNPIYNDSVYQKLIKTEKYESPQDQQEEQQENNVDLKLGYVYTNILNRYCGCDDSFDTGGSESASCEIDNKDDKAVIYNENNGDDEKLCDSNIDEQNCENISGDNT